MSKVPVGCLGNGMQTHMNRMEFIKLGFITVSGPSPSNITHDLGTGNWNLMNIKISKSVKLILSFRTLENIKISQNECPIHFMSLICLKFL